MRASLCEYARKVVSHGFDFANAKSFIGKIFVRKAEFNKRGDTGAGERIVIKRHSDGWKRNWGQNTL